MPQKPNHRAARASAGGAGPAPQPTLVSASASLHLPPAPTHAHALFSCFSSQSNLVPWAALFHLQCQNGQLFPLQIQICAAHSPIDFSMIFITETWKHSAL